MRQSEIVPAGRLITLRHIHAKDVPDVDLRGGKKNISDPYLKFAVLNEQGSKEDEQRLPHIENSRNPQWKEHVRLFFPNNEAQSKKTPDVRLHITLLDNNNKKADTLIGDVEVKIPAGQGKIKIEIPSRSPSSWRAPRLPRRPVRERGFG